MFDTRSIFSPARANFDLGPHFTVGANYRLPSEAGVDYDNLTEHGGSVSLTYKLLRD